MRLDLKTWAYDILTAIQEIETFLLDVPDFSTYEADLKTKRAVERNLEIIGEAMNRMLSAQPDRRSPMLGRSSIRAIESFTVMIRSLTK